MRERDWINQWDVLDYMQGFRALELDDASPSDVPGHGMPQPRPETKRTNKRDHSAAFRHWRAIGKPSPQRLPEHPSPCVSDRWARSIKAARAAYKRCSNN